MVFSGAESQVAFHSHLAGEQAIDWNRVNVFSVDELWSPELPPGCAVAAQPRRDLYRIVKPRNIHSIRFDAPDPETERARYDALVADHPADVVCIGVGVSGHIALNEPGPTAFVYVN